ncbi:hypothetical protein [Mesorhizobium sp.]|nr:hypothetical protein [Mesorhizobium sp.]
MMPIFPSNPRHANHFHMIVKSSRQLEILSGCAILAPGGLGYEEIHDGPF